MFSQLFHSHKTRLSLFTTEITDFPTLSYTSTEAWKKCPFRADRSLQGVLPGVPKFATKIVKDQVEHLIFKYEACKTLPLLVLSNLELVQIFLFLVRKHVKGAGGRLEKYEYKENSLNLEKSLEAPYPFINNI